MITPHTAFGCCDKRPPRFRRRRIQVAQVDAALQVMCVMRANVAAAEEGGDREDGVETLPEYGAGG